MKKRIFTVLAVSFVFSVNVFAQKMTAKQLVTEAAEKDTVDQTVSFIQKNIGNTSSPAEKRSALAFLGGIQEQTGQYSQAIKSYAEAASIAAADAPGMTKISSEQLVLNAVRCALSAGDWESAQSYLNSAVRNSNSEKIIAYVKLYEQWTSLCRAEKLSETEETVVLLKAYSNLSSMKEVRPQILFTLWYITGEEEFSARLKKEFPKSPECKIVKGEIQLLPAPFWYFVPRTGNAVPDVDEAQALGNADLKKASETSAAQTKSSNSASSKSAEKQEKIVYQQLGLFREKENAEGLVQRLKEKGFDARITKETRPSGTTYFIVIMDEDKDGTTGKKLRTAGFDCYPVFE